MIKTEPFLYWLLCFKKKKKELEEAKKDCKTQKHMTVCHSHRPSDDSPQDTFSTSFRYDYLLAI